MERSGISVALVVAIVLVAAIVFSIFTLYNSNQQTNAPAQISISVGSFAAVADSQAQIPVVITNSGGQASQIIVTLSSQAFGSAQLQSVSLGPNKYTTVDSTPSIGDIQPGLYQLSIQYTYHDSNGTHSMGAGAVSFTVVPSIKIAGFSWETTGFLITSPKSTIGSNDNTQVFLKISSNSQSQTYNGLVATIEMVTSAQGLTITPTSLPLGAIGPQGTSQQYSFTLTSNNTPPGKYSLELLISYSNSVGIATYAFELTVS